MQLNFQHKVKVNKRHIKLQLWRKVELFLRTISFNNIMTETTNDFACVIFDQTFHGFKVIYSTIFLKSFKGSWHSGRTFSFVLKNGSILSQWLQLQRQFANSWVEFYRNATENINMELHALLSTERDCPFDAILKGPNTNSSWNLAVPWHGTWQPFFVRCRLESNSY